MEIWQNFVAFSEYMNFKIHQELIPNFESDGYYFFAAGKKILHIYKSAGIVPLKYINCDSCTLYIHTKNSYVTFSLQYY